MGTDIRQQAYAAAHELCECAGLKAGQIMVIGCSTSEVVGSRIGTNSDVDVALELFLGIKKALDEKGVYLAAQCCEHLNRAIVVEEAAVPGADIVNVIPQKKAGGSFAAQAYAHFEHPVALEQIKAHAGILKLLRFRFDCPLTISDMRRLWRREPDRSSSEAAVRSMMIHWVLTTGMISAEL